MPDFGVSVYGNPAYMLHWRMARPKSDNPLINIQGRVYQTDREYLALWHSEEGTALREIIDRARKMWPNGPFTAGGGTKKTSRPIMTASLKAYAEKQGLTPQNAAAEIVANFLRNQSLQEQQPKQSQTPQD